jgi:putative heme-binding domain-containing protein
MHRLISNTLIPDLHRTITFALLLSILSLSSPIWAVPQTSAPPATAASKPKLDSVVRLIKLTWKANPAATAKSIMQLATQIQSSPEDIGKVKQLLEPSNDLLDQALSQKDDPRFAAVSCLTASWNDPRGVANALQLIMDENQPVDIRQLAGTILVNKHSEKLNEQIAASFANNNITASIQAELSELALRVGNPSLIEVVLTSIPSLPSEIRPTIVERATQRPSTSLSLLQLVEQKKIAKDLFNTNLLQRLEESGDPKVREKLKAIWGTIRLDNHEDRLKVIKNTQKTLRELKGNVDNGWIVYQRVCGQCHVLHDRGYEVGPALTNNGRGSYSQLLSNVLDPSLVIGNAYQAYTVLTTDGRVITGLVAEDSPEKIVLKIQGGKLETIPREEVEEAKLSTKSLMPEGLESQMTPQEIADLFALLTLEKAPGNQPNALIPETPSSLHGQ